ncbi:hypothetical protein NA256_10825 [Salmonella sp. NW805]|uniref:hypothetical protein n=1 Tax=unclassified Salmonella TaxID=2614656 RepID=UPI003F42CC54|nr:hypothetical protein [Salmonella enterica]HBM0506683.1 hypothetical protein [Salmonella enterica]
MQNENQHNEHKYLYSDVLRSIKTGGEQGNISALLAFIDNSPLVKSDRNIAAIEEQFSEARNKINNALAGCAEASKNIKGINDEIKKHEEAINKINANIKKLSEEASEVILSGDDINIEKQNGLAYIAGGEIAIGKINKVISELHDRRNAVYAVLSDAEESLRVSNRYASRLYAEIQARKFFIVAGCLITRIYEISPEGSYDGNFNPESWDCNVFSDLLKSAKNITGDNTVIDDVLNLASEYKYKTQRHSPFSVVRNRMQSQSKSPRSVLDVVSNQTEF